MKYQGLRLERVLASKQFDGRVFRNPAGPWKMEPAKIVPMLPDLIFGAGRRRPEAPLPVERPHERWSRPSSSGLRVTWLGHSTVLVEMDGYRILTDPVFAERASPFTFAGPKRFHRVPVTLEELPPLDAVVLSHDHYDHLCGATIRAVAKLLTVPVVTSLGVGARLEALGVPAERIHELDWNESWTWRGLQVTATPSQHFSGRGVGDRDQTLWSSWVMKTERHNVFFSGDTGLSEQFREIGLKYGPFDLSMIEVGAFQAGFQAIHLGPENALHVLEMLGGGILLPVHWGTFDLALHPWDEPAETLVRLSSERGVRVVTPRVGQAVEPLLVDSVNPWWREVALSTAQHPLEPERA